MGCCIGCISRYKPKKPSPKEQTCPIQEKVIILSQVHPTPLTIDTPYSFKNESSSASSSITTHSTTTTSGTASNTSSSSGRLSSNKERSFSNEFLLSCIKENPHLIRVIDDLDSKMINPENYSPKKIETPIKSSSSSSTSSSSSSSSSSSIVVTSKPSVILLQKKYIHHQLKPQMKIPTSGYSPVISKQKSFRKSSEVLFQPERNRNLVTSTTSTSITRRNLSGNYSRNGADMYGNGISKNSSPINKKFNNHEEELGFSKPKNVSFHDYNYCSPSPSARNNNKENFPHGSQEFYRNRPNGYGSMEKDTACGNTSHRRLRGPRDLDGEVNKNSSLSVLGEMNHTQKDYSHSLEIDDLENPHISLDCFIFL